jgi:quinol monooxygenase YgiN
MLIAIVEFTVSKVDRDAALAALLDEAPTVRAMAGCIAFRPFADPEDTTICGIVHEWETEAAFNGYASSPGFAAVGQILRPMMTAPPISRRFSAKMIETVA